MKLNLIVGVAATAVVGIVVISILKTTGTI